MSQGIIFNIQKFSLHDGPGIRTTVFFKGCPLKCQWCANPESQLKRIQILHDQKKCVHCLSCLQACPHQAIKFISDHIQFHDCHGCLQCLQHCPQNALSFEGEYKSVQEVVDICLQDQDFYEESHGGVTFSGGEAMSQPDFAKELVYALKKHHLHVAIETTGYAKEEIFCELAPLFDLLLFDVKHYDTQKHYEGTGVYHELIIKNLKWAIAHHIEVLVRIPVIPGFNAAIEDAYGFADLLKNLHISKVQLLPFHQFGEKKYELLHKDYAYKNKKALYPEDLKDYQQIFINKGLDCFF